MTDPASAADRTPRGGETDLDIEWLDDDHLRVGDGRFELFFAPESSVSGAGPCPFRVEKTRAMVEFYRERFGGRPLGNMVEIGIRHGGSLALFDRLLQPAKLVAIDLDAEAPPGLQGYIRANRAEARLRPRFGIDQGDAAALRRVLAEEFGGEPLDLVIDDGCHWLAESRTSFNTLFPCLRPSGFYVLEDWGWAHWPGMWQERGGPWVDRPSLTQLVVELVMTAASRPDVVASVEVRPELVVVKAGGSAVEPGFDISRSFLTAGRRFAEQGPHATVVGRLRTRLLRLLRSATSRARALRHAGPSG